MSEVMFYVFYFFSLLVVFVILCYVTMSRIKKEDTAGFAISRKYVPPGVRGSTSDIAN
jgi:hypothetical protein